MARILRKTAPEVTQNPLTPDPEGIAYLRARSEENEDGCWLWSLYLDPAGYGRGRKFGKRWGAARLAWVVCYGEIPADMTIDHLCFARSCVNPLHLRLLTRSENCSNLGYSYNVACKRGHLYTEENTYIATTKGRPSRVCRTCRGMSKRGELR